MAVAVVIDDGDSRIAIVALDTIGLMRKFVLDVRQSVPAAWGIDYLMVHATHNHEGPDTQGLWGRDYSAAVDAEYMLELKRSILATLESAVSNLEPAEMSIARITADPRTRHRQTQTYCDRRGYSRAAVLPPGSVGYRHVGQLWYSCRTCG